MRYGLRPFEFGSHRIHRGDNRYVGAVGRGVNWEAVSVNLTADATTDLLSFLAWGDNGNTTNLPPIAFLSGVNSPATLSGTPLPATLPLLGIGLVGLGGMLRRRRAKDATAS